MEILLKLIVPEGLLRQWKQTAAWPDEAPGSRDELKEHIKTLIESVTEVVPLKTDWARKQTCRQRSAEDPLELLERIRGVYCCEFAPRRRANDRVYPIAAASPTERAIQS